MPLWLTIRKALVPLTTTRATQSPRETLAEEKEATNQQQQQQPNTVNQRQIIQVASELKLPFSAEVAYDAYSDLPRQPLWSSWLQSVEYLDDTNSTTRWTMKVFGLKYSWDAVAVTNDRPHMIQWKSTSGLANFGTVQFRKDDDDDDDGGTWMHLNMTFVAPRAAASLFRRSKTFSKFVERKVITASMIGFRDVVLEEQSSKSKS